MLQSHRLSWSLVVAATFSAGCTAVLGVTDVPAGVSDAGGDAEGGSSSTSSGSSDGNGSASSATTGGSNGGTNTGSSTGGSGSSGGDTGGTSSGSATSNGAGSGTSSSGASSSGGSASTSSGGDAGLPCPATQPPSGSACVPGKYPATCAYGTQNCDCSLSSTWSCGTCPTTEPTGTPACTVPGLKCLYDGPLCYCDATAGGTPADAWFCSN